MPVDLDRHRSLVSMLQEAFATHADRVALVSLGAELTYGQLDQHSQAWAAWLQSLDLPRGARVAIMLPNMLASPVTLIGTLKAGTVADMVVLDARATPEMALRADRIETLAEELFLLMIMGDDRAVAQTYVAGAAQKDV